MKTTRSLIGLALAASVLVIRIPVAAQSSQDQPPSPSQAGAIDDESMRRNFEEAKREVERSRREMEQAERMAQAKAGTLTAANSANMQPALQKLSLISSEDRFKNFIFRLNGPSEQSLVIASSEITPGVINECNEDLNIMAKLLDDAMADDHADVVTGRAMGIPVNLNLAGRAGRERHLYVDGYGAIFEIPVQFFLSPPSNVKSDPGPKSSKSSAWDAARRELYAQPGDNVDLTPENDPHFAYSAERVDSLKQSILKALANAANFRHLKPNERITVVLLSPGESKVFVSPSAGGPGQPAAFPAKSPGTTLTISVKKSDADELAAGKINENDFRKRAAIALY